MNQKSSHQENYESERKRLKTFEKSKRFCPFMVTELSRNGFFFDKGKVTCAFCFKVLEKFYSREAVVKRHFELTQNCNVYMRDNLNIPIDSALFEKEKENFCQLRRAKGLFVPKKIVSNATITSEIKHQENEVQHPESNSLISGDESVLEKKCCGQIFACELRSLIAEYRKMKKSE